MLTESILKKSPGTRCDILYLAISPLFDRPPYIYIQVSIYICTRITKSQTSETAMKTEIMFY